MERELAAYRLRIAALEKIAAVAGQDLEPLIADLVQAASTGDTAGVTYLREMLTQKLASRRAGGDTVHALLCHPRFVAGTARIRYCEGGMDPSELGANTVSRNILISCDPETGLLHEVFESDDGTGTDLRDWTPTISEYGFQAELDPHVYEAP